MAAARVQSSMNNFNLGLFCHFSGKKSRNCVTNIKFWKVLNLEEKASIVGRVYQLEAFVHLTQYGTLKMIHLFILTTAQ